MRRWSVIPGCLVPCCRFKKRRCSSRIASLLLRLHGCRMEPPAPDRHWQLPPAPKVTFPIWSNKTCVCRINIRNNLIEDTQLQSAVYIWCFVPCKVFRCVYYDYFVFFYLLNSIAVHATHEIDKPCYLTAERGSLKDICTETQWAALSSFFIRLHINTDTHIT